MIVIGFSRPKKFKIMSYIIRLLERTKFSHVYLKINIDTLDRELICQASGIQVNFVGDTLFKEQNETIEEFEIHNVEDVESEVLKNCVDLVGKPYGIKQLLGLLVVQIAGFFGKKIKNPFADKTKTYICSELVGQILTTHFEYNIADLDTLTPKDIYLLLINHKAPY